MALDVTLAYNACLCLCMLDDLMLVAGSLSQLQSMINMCTAELDSLDLSVNVKKLRLYSNWQRF